MIIFKLWSQLFWKYYFPGKQFIKYLHVVRLLKAVYLWITVQNSTTIAFCFKKQCPDNSSKRYFVQMNWGACRSFKVGVIMLEVAHILCLFSISVIHEGMLNTYLLSSQGEFHRNSSKDLFHFSLVNYFCWRLGI